MCVYSSNIEQHEEINSFIWCGKKTLFKKLNIFYCDCSKSVRMLSFIQRIDNYTQTFSPNQIRFNHRDW